MPRGRAALIVSFLIAGAVPGAAAQETDQGLPELTSAQSRERCPAPDERAAREAISGAARRMRDMSAVDRITVQERSVQRTVPVTSVGRSPVPRGTASSSRGSIAFERTIWLEAMGVGVFARPRFGTSPGGRFESWEYAPLFAEHAQYFFTRAFLDAHSFSFSDSDSRHIGFCARTRRDTYIDGRVVLHPSGAVATVEWAYITPTKDEGAGGRAVFDASSRVPLPSSGVFWRRLALDDYLESASRYSEWSMTGAP